MNQRTGLFNRGGVHFLNPKPKDPFKPYNWQCFECKDQDVSDSEEAASQSLLDHLNERHAR